MPGMQRVQRRAWICLGDDEQRACRSSWAAVALLPILERPGADTDQRGELLLRETHGRPDCDGIGLGNSRCSQTNLALAEPPRLAKTLS